ncbi:MAG: hypothetical protein Q8Q89_00900 [bacterium]|nr:hypothetical protein [bacterium]
MVLQELVTGRENGEDYEVWQDVPIVNGRDSDEKIFKSHDTVCD